MKKLLLLLFLTLPGGLWSQNTSAASLKVPVLSPNSTISVLTMGPGKEIYLAFGHSAFLVQDPDTRFERVFNYGTFDVTDPLFIPLFIRGELNYSLSIQPFQAYLNYDASTQNRVWIQQKLNLTQDEKQALFAYLLNNAREENRYYLYDFIKDNCSTRITDALRAVLGNSLRLTSITQGHKSYRTMLDEYAGGRPAWQFLMHLAIGTAVDQSVAPLEEDWLPFYLLEMMDKARLVKDGGEVPLVSQRTLLYKPVSPAGYDTPWMDPQILFWVLALVFIGFTLYRSWPIVLKRPLEWPKTQGGEKVADGVLFFLFGLAGAILFYLEFFSIHTAAKGNLNLIWTGPLLLVAGILSLKTKPSSLGRWVFLLTALGAAAPVLLRLWWPQNQLTAFIPLQLTLLVRSLWHFLRLKNRG